MKASDIQSRLTRGYLELMKNLSIRSKLDIISRLTESMKSDIQKSRSSFEKSFGAWDKTESADDITRSIRASRILNRQTEEL